MSCLAQARALLETVTPLRADCGELCGKACCASLQGETTGMLLFPGEEALYADKPGWRVLEHRLVVCPGRCLREERPLSCRLFPLLPLLRESGVRVAMDARARAVCPLYAQGVHALSEDLIEAMRHAGQLLAEDSETRDFLMRLTREQDELRALQRQFREGGRNGGRKERSSDV